VRSNWPRAIRSRCAARTPCTVKARQWVERDLSQENLAVDAGIDRTYVSRLERGRENPMVRILDQLAEALNAGIVEFFVVPSLDDSPPKALRGKRRAKN
jgi:transcriptional regulator with XRE-family HTH domain